MTTKPASGGQLPGVCIAPEHMSRRQPTEGSDVCTPHSGRAHWPLTTCEGGKEGVRREGAANTRPQDTSDQEAGRRGRHYPEPEAQPHWLREKEGTESRHQGGVGLWTQHGGTRGLLPRAGRWWRVSGCAHLSSAGQPSPIPTSLRAHQATVHPDGGPAAHLRSHSPAPAVQGRHTWDPRHPSAPNPQSTEGPGAPSTHTGSPSPPVVWAKCTFWQLEGGKGRVQTFWLL